MPEDLTVVCDHCEALIWRRNDYGDSTIHLCEVCRDDDYNYCCECNRLILNSEIHYLNVNDDDGFCDDCYQSCYQSRCSEQVIQNYYYKPTPIFYGEGNRLFGVELEMDGGASGTPKPDKSGTLPTGTAWSMSMSSTTVLWMRAWNWSPTP